MARGATTTSVKGTRGDDPNLTVPAGVSITSVTIDGLAGNDTLDLSSYTSGVTIGLNSGAKSVSYVTARPFMGLFPDPVLRDSTTVNGSIRNVENLIGTAYNDALTISLQSTNKLLDGGGGNDRLTCTGGGNVLIVGGEGNDWLLGTGTVTYVGGTYANGIATGDGQADYFLCAARPTILDFEVGLDRLIFEIATGLTMADYLAGTWVASGATGAALIVNGVAQVTLANVAPLMAQTIDLGFQVFADASGRVEGSSGDDILYPGQAASAQYVFGANSGNDIAASFDILTDVLVFEDGIVPVWSDTLVNGAPALLGTWADGSVTIQGLDTGDVPQLQVQNVTGAPQYGTSGPGPWSAESDYPAPVAAAVTSAGEGEAAAMSVALMGG